MFSALLNLLPGAAGAKAVWGVLKYVLMIGVPIAIIGFLWWKFTSLENANKIAQAQLAVQAQNLAVQQQTIAAQSTSITNWSSALGKYQQDAADQAAFNLTAVQPEKDMADAFAKHNLTALSIAKPAAIELRVNRGTVDAFQLLSCSSASAGCPAAHPATATGNSSSEP